MEKRKNGLCRRGNFNIIGYAVKANSFRLCMKTEVHNGGTFFIAIFQKRFFPG
jgi:hypothetical protein